ncbi:MAG: response regulator [Thermodesulfobacteriota bacterium]
MSYSTVKNQPALFVVDDDDATRKLLRVLGESLRLRVETFATAEQFLERGEPQRPACLVVDVRMPGMSGLQLQDRLNERGIDLPVIMLTAHGDVPTAVRSMRAGAIDFFQKPAPSEELAQRIQEAIEHDVATYAGRARRKDVQRRLATLTPRERQVLQLVCEGKTSKEIAQALGASVNTIQNHRARIMRKMGAPSVGSLVRMVAGVATPS